MTENVTRLSSRREGAASSGVPVGPPDIEMFMDDDRIIFRDQAILDDFVRGAILEALRKAADDFQRQWPVYGDDWLRERADALEAGQPATPLTEVTCTCGHLAIDHHGADPDDGCLGVASHRLPQCPCRLTSREVAP